MPCFVCGEDLGQIKPVTLKGYCLSSGLEERDGEPGASTVIYLHPRCAPLLAATILNGLAQSSTTANGPTIRVRYPEYQLYGVLTAAERRVLEGIVRGETNGQIARRLGLAVQTVRNTVSSILDKLDVESRTEAAVVALRLGLVD